MDRATSPTVARRKFLFGMSDYTTDSDAGTGDFSLVLGILDVGTHTCDRACLLT